MFSQNLNQAILKKNSRVCVGLDPRANLIPGEFFKTTGNIGQGFTNFNKKVIDIVAPHAAAVKLQSAFYEKYRQEGVASFWETAQYAKQKGLLVIADVKRGDIDSTAQAYADAYLGPESPFDCATINPFLGEDSLIPFIKTAGDNGKGVFILVKTSNPGSGDLQDLEVNGVSISGKVAGLIGKHVEEQDQHGYSSIGAVVGATYPEQAKKLRQLLPNSIFLVPGIGAQGGDIKMLKHFFKDGLGAIVNSSRGIVFSFDRNDKKFAFVIEEQAISLKNQINSVI